MKKIDKEGLEIFNQINKLQKAGKDEVLMIQQFIRNYIDAACTVCPNCPAQIRFHFKRVINWGKANNLSELTFEEPTIEKEKTVKPTIEKEIIIKKTKTIKKNGRKINP